MRNSTKICKTALLFGVVLVAAPGVSLANPIAKSAPTPTRTVAIDIPHDNTTAKIKRVRRELYVPQRGEVVYYSSLGG